MTDEQLQKKSEIAEAYELIKRWNELSGLEINHGQSTICVGSIEAYKEAQRVFGENTKIILLVDEANEQAE